MPSRASCWSARPSWTARSEHVQPDRYGINLRRAVPALAAGALTGALLITPLLVIGALADPLSNLGTQAIQMIVFEFLVLLAAWGAGLIVFGAPLWWLFHAKGWRSRRAACLLGAGTTFLVFLAFQLVLSRFYFSAFEMQSIDIFVWPGVFAVAGALVAAVIWLVAYRPIREE
jgi:hypothetical protein